MTLCCVDRPQGWELDVGVPGLRKGHWEPAKNIDRVLAARKAWDAKPPFWYREREWLGFGQGGRRLMDAVWVGTVCR